MIAWILEHLGKATAWAIGAIFAAGVTYSSIKFAISTNSYEIAEAKASIVEVKKDVRRNEDRIDSILNKLDSIHEDMGWVKGKLDRVDKNTRE